MLPFPLMCIFPLGSHLCAKSKFCARRHLCAWLLMLIFPGSEFDSVDNAAKSVVRHRHSHIPLDAAHKFVNQQQLCSSSRSSSSKNNSRDWGIQGRQQQ